MSLLQTLTRRPVYQALRSLTEPVLVEGPVVKGFGRGSKLLGFPTANIPIDCLDPAVLDQLQTGIYCGWAVLEDDVDPQSRQQQVRKMVMSIGWNPFFQNQQRTLEPYILHNYEGDFYGKKLRLIVTAFLRPEQSFPSLEALKQAIDDDAQLSRELLDTQEHQRWRPQHVST